MWTGNRIPVISAALKLPTNTAQKFMAPVESSNAHLQKLHALFLSAGTLKKMKG
jgi:hypothetical protein